MKESCIFKNLFVLEMANNHWGSLKRAKKIVKEFSDVVKRNNVKAAIKLQFRDIDTFIHTDYKKDGNGVDLTLLPKRSRYIQKTLKTKLSYDEMKELVTYIKQNGCIPMATPFDELSVELCVSLNLSIIKVASSDINDWTLLQKIAATKKPVILSSGGANDKQIDDVVTFFVNRNIPIALNHCISKYPTEDSEMELSQIDYLKNRYPNIIIGLSTHEYADWSSSMFISYAKGVRTWERHIDIPYPNNHEQKEISKYCSTPEQIDVWFKSYNKAMIMCGTSINSRRIIDEKESKYLEALYRGLYLKRDVKKGESITINDLYSAIPYQSDKGQLTSRELNGVDLVVFNDIKKDSPLIRKDILETK